MNRSKRWGWVALCAAAMLWFAGGTRADTAVVVGINRYPNLPYGQLKGCVNDANTMGDLLAKRGFNVVRLMDADATKRKILDKLHDLAKTVKPDEEFVFYFAGHGDRTRSVDGTVGQDSTGVLLPNDATLSGNEISRDELYVAVRSIPAKSWTILLDSCFAGSMTRALDPDQRVRFYDRMAREHQHEPKPAPSADNDTRGPAPPVVLTPVPLHSSDNVTRVAGGGDVCYFVAASFNEPANERTIEGTKHGVFTYVLESLLSSPTSYHNWGELQTAVAGNVASLTGDTQHPKLSTTFDNVPLFQSRSTAEEQPAAQALQPNTVWDEFNVDHSDETQLQLQMEPDRTPLNLGEHLWFTIKVGETPGYLVILERDSSNSIQQIYPMDDQGSPVKDLDAAKVSARQEITIPAGAHDTNYILTKTVGTEHIRAILFTSRDKAQALLDKFPANGVITNFVNSRRLEIVRTPPAPFYTSDLTFGVVKNP